MTCPDNSVCVEGATRPQCECSPGFTPSRNRGNGLSCECKYMYIVNLKKYLKFH